MVLGVVSRFCLFWLAVTSKGVAVFLCKKITLLFGSVKIIPILASSNKQTNKTRCLIVTTKTKEVLLNLTRTLKVIKTQ